MRVFESIFFKKHLNYTSFNISNCISICCEMYSGIPDTPDYTWFWAFSCYFLHFRIPLLAKKHPRHYKQKKLGTLATKSATLGKFLREFRKILREFWAKLTEYFF